MVISEVVIGSVQDDRDQAIVTVTADIDQDVLLKLSEHLQGVIRAGARFILVDLSRVRRSDPAVLELLSSIQLQLFDRSGMISVVGLAAGVLTDHATSAPGLVA